MAASQKCSQHSRRLLWIHGAGHFDESLLTRLVPSGWTVDAQLYDPVTAAEALSHCSGGVVIDSTVGVIALRGLRNLGLLGPSTPAILLCDNAPATVGFEAARLGFSAVLETPVDAAALSAVLTASSANHSCHQQRASEPSVHVADILECVGRWSSRSNPSIDTNQLIDALIRLMTDPPTSVPTFACLAAALRALVSPRESAPRLDGPLLLRRLQDVADSGEGPADGQAREALSLIVRTAVMGVPDPGVIAGALGLNKHELSEQLLRSTHLTLRAACRYASVQRVVLDLSHSQEMVSQIIYAAGYDSTATFGHLFHRLIGTSPRYFRALHRRASG